MEDWKYILPSELFWAEKHHMIDGSYFCNIGIDDM
jgi:hypothetical protein